MYVTRFHALSKNLLIGVVLLCLLPARLLAAAAGDIDQTFSVDSGGTLFIESDSGPIEVNTWDRQELRIRIFNTDDFDVSVEMQGKYRLPHSR